MDLLFLLRVLLLYYFFASVSYTHLDVYKRPLLVVSEIFGVHEYIQDVCRRLAHLGYLAIAPELFARQGDPSKYTEIPKLQAEIISKVPDKPVSYTHLDVYKRQWRNCRGAGRCRAARG